MALSYSLRNTALALVLSTLAGSLQAATLSYNFTSGGTNSASNAYGNVRTFTNGGVTVTATAWGLTGSSGTTFQTGQLGRFNTGLGVCNQVEGVNCGSPQHQADNSGSLDFILFQFGASVTPVSITIDPAGLFDRDISYWIGTTANPLNLAGQGLGSLAGLGFGPRVDSDSTASVNSRTVTLNGTSGNSILFGARTGSGADVLADYFKLTSMTVSTTGGDTQVIPEPGTFLSLGTALAAFGLMIKRQRAQR